MNTAFVLYVGVKNCVVAFDRANGAEIWRRKLKDGGMAAGGFVTTLTDGERVYAHASGSLYCLDARTGAVLWSNDLPGLGYGIASLAVVGASAPPAGVVSEKMRQESAASAGAGATAM